MTDQEYYAKHGHLVMASVRPEPMGPLNSSDWNEDEMTAYRWMVMSVATREDLEAQNLIIDGHSRIDHRYRYFYRIVAMD